MFKLCETCICENQCDYLHSFFLYPNCYKPKEEKVNNELSKIKLEVERLEEVLQHLTHKIEKLDEPKPPAEIIKEPIINDNLIFWTFTQRQQIRAVIQQYFDALFSNNFDECFSGILCPFCQTWKTPSLPVVFPTCCEDCPNMRINKILHITTLPTVNSGCNENSKFFFRKSIDVIKNGGATQKREVAFFRFTLWLDALQLTTEEFIKKYK